MKTLIISLAAILALSIFIAAIDASSYTNNIATSISMYQQTPFVIKVTTRKLHLIGPGGRYELKYLNAGDVAIWFGGRGLQVNPGTRSK